MSEYTYTDLIVDPELPGVRNLIGKEVYYNSVPSRCVLLANKGLGVGILKEIRKDEYFPFYVETQNGDTVSYICYSCIIPKKEEPKPEPKYEPFKSVIEFLNGYSHVETKNLDNAHRYLYSQGIWLKEKRADDPDTFCMVNEFRKEGVFVGHADVVIDDGISYTTFTPWSKLCQGYTFLDGSPCGKIVEEDKCQ